VLIGGHVHSCEGTFWVELLCIEVLVFLKVALLPINVFPLNDRRFTTTFSVLVSVAILVCFWVWGEPDTDLRRVRIQELDLVIVGAAISCSFFSFSA